MNFPGWRAVPISPTLGFPGLRSGWADPINLRLGDGFNPIRGDDLGMVYCWVYHIYL